ncbi:MAG: transporter [Phycisphaeraceae bacterium]|nr:transporter [Phycisphaeraceae bacterium]
MLDQATIMGLVFAVFLVLGVGACLRQFNWLTHEADESLLKVVIRVLMPCFFINHVVGNPKFMHFTDAWLPPTIGFGSTVVGYIIALLFAKLCGKWVGLKTPVAQHTFALCVGTFNYGYIPMPLVEAMFPNDNGATMGTLIVHNLGVEIAIWTVGLLVLQGKLNRNSWKRAMNPPFFAILFSLLINQFRLYEVVPDAIGVDLSFLSMPIKLLAQATIPMGLIMVGATMADQFGQARSQLLTSWQSAFAGILLRLVALPVLFILVASWLPQAFDSFDLKELKTVMVIQAAMPCAVFPIVLAKHYGGDTAVALRVVFATSIIAILTIPTVIAQGLGFVFG